MNTIIYLVRHGAVVNPDNLAYGREIDVPLSDSGIESVGVLGKLILEREDHPVAVYSSPMSRARATAKILADALGLVNVEILADLNEIDTPGLKKYTMQQLNEYEDFYNFPIKGIVPEKPEAVIERMSRAIKSIAGRNKNKTAIAVSHGDPIAFFTWSLRFAERGIPKSRELDEANYPAKGSAWRLTFTADFKFVSGEQMNYHPEPRIKDLKPD